MGGDSASGALRTRGWLFNPGERVQFRDHRRALRRAPLLAAPLNPQRPQRPGGHLMEIQFREVGDHQVLAAAGLSAPGPHSATHTEPPQDRLSDMTWHRAPTARMRRWSS